MTNLRDLLAVAPAPVLNLVPRLIEWKMKNLEGKVETFTADIFVVERVSFAASDRIYFGSRDADDRSAIQRSIVERIRLGEHGEEQLTLQQVRDLPPELGWALSAAITKLDRELDPEPDEDVKDSSQTKSSGTNSSSTESVAPPLPKPKKASR